MTEKKPGKRLPKIVTRLFWIAVISVIASTLYSWVEPRAYDDRAQYSFAHGALHGALMPLALPSLLMGHDVQIAPETKQSIRYRVGYILGVNLCGLVFFGSVFARRSRKLDGAANPITGGAEK